MTIAAISEFKLRDAINLIKWIFSNHEFVKEMAQCKKKLDLYMTHI